MARMKKNSIIRASGKIGTSEDVHSNPQNDIVLWKCGKYSMVISNYPFLIKAIKLFLVTVLFMLFFQSSIMSEEYDVNLKQRGILSKDRTDHQYIRGDLIISIDWVTIENRKNLFCKWFNEKISIEALKKIIIFEDGDLMPMTDEMQSNYDESSVYFKSCNYVDGYRNPLFRWGKDENTLLEWKNSDAYIDTKYSLLLIDYIDEQQKIVRAVFIDKKHQFISNEVMGESLWDKLLNLIGRGHRGRP